jgi:hypothetical protein
MQELSITPQSFKTREGGSFRAFTCGKQGPKGGEACACIWLHFFEQLMFSDMAANVYAEF